MSERFHEGQSSFLILIFISVAAAALLMNLCVFNERIFGNFTISLLRERERERILNYKKKGKHED